MKRALAISLLCAACTSTTSSPYGDGYGTPDNPAPQQSDQGPYAVVTTVDLTAEAIAPPQVELVISTLREFSMNPAKALIDLATAKGLPVIGTLSNLLPSVLMDQLEGWINDEINKVKIDGKSVQEWAGDLVKIIDTALASFDLDSELAIDLNATKHTLTGLELRPLGHDIKVAFALPGTFAADILSQTPALAISEGGAFTLSDQHFGLAYGEYAWLGINQLTTITFGGDIRTVLGNALDCPKLAQAVASKCVLGVCVGHETELEALCGGSLDLLVNEVHDQLSALRFDVLHFASGAGTFLDNDQDGVADQITGGTWNAELNLGMGLRHTPATFTGSR